MGFILAAVYIALAVFQILLLARIVFDVVESFVPSWRPRGVVLVLASAVMSVTDRPLRFVRDRLPPLNLGAVQLDLAFIVLFLAVSLLKVFLQVVM